MLSLENLNEMLNPINTFAEKVNNSVSNGFVIYVIISIILVTILVICSSSSSILNSKFAKILRFYPFIIFLIFVGMIIFTFSITEVKPILENSEIVSSTQIIIEKGEHKDIVEGGGNLTHFGGTIKIDTNEEYKVYYKELNSLKQTEMKDFNIKKDKLKVIIIDKEDLKNNYLEINKIKETYDLEGNPLITNIQKWIAGYPNNEIDNYTFTLYITQEDYLNL